MQRKGNPFVSLVGLVLLALILVLTLTACTVRAEWGTTTASAAEQAKERFSVLFENTDNALTLYIITDTETGKQYLFGRERFGNGMGGGMCLLEE